MGCKHKGCESGLATEQVSYKARSGGFGNRELTHFVELCEPCKAELGGKYIKSEFYIAGGLAFDESIWVVNEKGE